MRSDNVCTLRYIIDFNISLWKYIYINIDIKLYNEIPSPTRDARGLVFTGGDRDLTYMMPLALVSLSVAG